MGYKYTIEYKCGHKKTYELNQKPESPVKHIDTECEECRAKINGKMLTRAELESIKPELKGSEKQINAAEPNRDRFIQNWVKSASDTQADIIREIITNENYAGWWLDHYKEVHTDEFIIDYREKYKTRKRKSGAKKAEKKISETRKEEIMRHVLTPEELKHNELILIELIDSQTMSIKSSSKASKELTALLSDKGFAYIPEKDRFIRELNEFTGNYSDRAAEAGITLLDNGYMVSVINKTILNMIRSRKYTPQNDKWIKYFNSDSVYLDWTGYQRVLCNRALAFIENAHWDNHFKKVVVPASSFKQLMDYAQRYGFSIENRALKLMESKRRKSI